MDNNLKLIVFILILILIVLCVKRYKQAIIGTGDDIVKKCSKLVKRNSMRIITHNNSQATNPVIKPIITDLFQIDDDFIKQNKIFKFMYETNQDKFKNIMNEIMNYRIKITNELNLLPETDEIELFIKRDKVYNINSLYDKIDKISNNKYNGNKKLNILHLLWFINCQKESFNNIRKYFMAIQSKIFEIIMKNNKIDCKDRIIYIGKNTYEKNKYKYTINIKNNEIIEDIIDNDNDKYNNRLFEIIKAYLMMDYELIIFDIHLQFLDSENKVILNSGHANTYLISFINKDEPRCYLIEPHINNSWTDNVCNHMSKMMKSIMYNDIYEKTTFTSLKFTVDDNQNITTVQKDDSFCQTWVLYIASIYIINFYTNSQLYNFNDLLNYTELSTKYEKICETLYILYYILKKEDNDYKKFNKQNTLSYSSIDYNKNIQRKNELFTEASNFNKENQQILKIDNDVKNNEKYKYNVKEIDKIHEMIKLINNSMEMYKSYITFELGDNNPYNLILNDEQIKLFDDLYKNVIEKYIS